MTIRRVVPNIATRHLDESVRFYTDFLGFQVAMHMDWIVTLCSTTNETAQISLLQSDSQSEPEEKITISIEVENVDKLHEDANAAGYSIPYPLTNEPWGVRRFFVLDPNGVTINVMQHNA